MTSLRKPIKRVTNTPLDGSFGSDRHRRIVITIVPGNGNDTPDCFMLRPQGTRRPEQIAVIDVYRIAMRSRVNKEQLDKARARKAKLSDKRAAARLDRQEAKFRNSIKS